MLLLDGSHKPLITCKMRLYSRHQLAGAEGLCHIIIRTQAESADLINVILSRGYHKDRDVLLLADLLANLKAIHSGHHQIQDDQIVISLQCSL